MVEAYPNVSSLDLTQVQRTVEGVLDKVVLAVRFMALFSLAAGAVVLAGAVAASRYQRVREGALLRTLGARRSQLLRILLTEYAVLGALAAGAAILLSTLAGWALVRFVFGGTFALPGPALLALLVGVLALTSWSGCSAAPRSGAARRSRCCGRSDVIPRDIRLPGPEGSTIAREFPKARRSGGSFGARHDRAPQDDSYPRYAGSQARPSVMIRSRSGP